MEAREGPWASLMSAFQTAPDISPLQTNCSSPKSDRTDLPLAFPPITPLPTLIPIRTSEEPQIPRQNDHVGTLPALPRQTLPKPTVPSPPSSTADHAVDADSIFTSGAAYMHVPWRSCNRPPVDVESSGGATGGVTSSNSWQNCRSSVTDGLPRSNDPRSTSSHSPTKRSRVHTSSEPGISDEWVTGTASAAGPRWPGRPESLHMLARDASHRDFFQRDDTTARAVEGRGPEAACVLPTSTQEQAGITQECVGGDTSREPWVPALPAREAAQTGNRGHGTPVSLIGQYIG